MRRAVIAAVAVAGAAAGLVGCGDPDPPGPASVRGTVRFGGKPLAGGRVVFAPDRDRGNPGRVVSAAIGEDGTYRLAPDGGDAVPPGWYRGAIADPPAGPADADLPRFPPSLRRPDKAGLDREVRAGRENVFDFLIEVAD